MKKINSEIKFSNDLFKVKVGTTNKKNPETIYIEMGTYLLPTLSKFSFVDDFAEVNKIARKYVKTRLLDIKQFGNDFIFIDDIASDRVSEGKKSYYEIQLYLQPTKQTIKNNSFKKIAESLNKDYILDFVSYMKNDLDKRGYVLSKTK